MSEIAKPSGRFGQFYLSTLLVLVLVVGGVNFWPQRDAWQRRCYGFPILMLMVPTVEYAQQRRDTLQRKESDDWIKVGSAMRFEENSRAPLYYIEFSWLRAVGNLLIWSVCLVGVDFLIRSREDRNT